MSLDRLRRLVQATAGALVVYAQGVALAADIAGSVRADVEPVSGAVVRVQGTSISTVSSDNGTFVITDVGAESGIYLTAWAPGYYIARSAAVHPGADGVEIVLTPHSASDNLDYRWILVDEPIGKGEGGGCVHCHSRAGTSIAFELPVDQWRRDAHAGSGTNPRFLSMYLGTDLEGHQSPPTRYRLDREYGPSPIRPDPDEPYFGPGYRLDFPETAGNCAACHAPMAAAGAPYDTDPVTAGRLGEEGVGCDFCHKIWSIRVDPVTGLPYPNTPGVLSIELRRPEADHQLFIGPLDDVAPGEDTYSPLQRDSAVCAPCHFGTFWSTVVYGSYAEWLDSPYADPETGQSCQDCHMPVLGARQFALPEAGSLTRDPGQVHSHLMPGAGDSALLRSAVEMTVSTKLAHDAITVEVTIANVGAGHYVPTDSPLRHLILVVQATASNARPLELLAGERVPEWGGTGAPEDGDYAGLPGTAYARVLEELATHTAPTAAYWNPTRVESDTRIPPLSATASRFVFKVPAMAEGSAEIDAVLLYRRAFRTLMELKGWDVPDIIMARHTESVRLGAQGEEP